MGSHASPPARTLTLPAPPEDVRAVLDALRRIVRALRLTAAAGQRIGGITAAQLFVLQRLAERPAHSIAELAERTLTDPSSVSVVIRNLVAAGLVRQTRSQVDTRRTELSMTARGVSLLRRLPVAAQARLVEAVAALPGLERRALARSLGHLVASLGTEEAPAPLFFEDAAAPKKGRKSRAKAGGTP